MQVGWWYLVVSAAALGAGCDRFPGQLGSVRAEAEARLHGCAMPNAPMSGTAAI